MSNSYKASFFSGLKWASFQNIVVKGLGLLFSIILARILAPEDFGLIGLLSVFILLSQVFMESGITEALIQKTDCSSEDYSTAFYFNTVVSVMIYVVLYVAAPFIASFYRVPDLCLLTRVLSINIIIGSFNIVQRAKLTRAMDFRSLAIISSVGLIVGGVVGLLMAYWGFGVWSLVLQTLVSTFSSFLLFPYYSRWYPKWKYSMESFKRLWKYGSKLIVTGVLNVIIMNLSTILIGRLYKTNQVGYYTRAQGFAEMPANVLLSVLSSVSFPVLCKTQSEKEYQLMVYKRILFNAVLLVFPIMILLAILSRPLILVLLTDKWLPSVTIMQLLLLGRMFMPIGAMHNSLLRSVGNTTLYMKLYFIDAPLTLLGILLSAPFGIEAMALSTLITSFIMYLITSSVIGRLFNYGVFAQFYDWRKIICSLAIMSVCVSVVFLLFSNEYAQLMVGGMIGILSYAICCKLFRLIDDDVANQLKNMVKKHKIA